MMNKPPKELLEQVKDKLRLKHYSIRTEKSYRYKSADTEFSGRQHLPGLAFNFGSLLNLTIPPP